MCAAAPAGLHQAVALACWWLRLRLDLELFTEKVAVNPCCLGIPVQRRSRVLTGRPHILRNTSLVHDTRQVVITRIQLDLRRFVLAFQFDSEDERSKMFGTCPCQNSSVRLHPRPIQQLRHGRACLPLYVNLRRERAF